MTDETRVDPVVLHTIAQDTRQVGSDLRARVDQAAEPAIRAARALPGLATSSALTRLAQAWEDDARSFATHLSGMADALELCARDYAYTEHATAANFNGLSR